MITRIKEFLTLFMFSLWLMYSLHLTTCIFVELAYNNILAFLFISPRHILASLHFNGNIHRETQLSKEGTEYMGRTWGGGSS